MTLSLAFRELTEVQHGFHAFVGCNLGITEMLMIARIFHFTPSPSNLLFQSFSELYSNLYVISLRTVEGFDHLEMVPYCGELLRPNTVHKMVNLAGIRRRHQILSLAHSRIHLHVFL